MVISAEFVMDASFAIPWVFRDEANCASDEAWERLIEKTATAHVPGLWPLEMVSVTLRGPRKGKPSPTREQADAFLTILRRMPLRVHHFGIETFLEGAPMLMRKHGLSAYDCAYLILARSNRLPLATLDDKLAKAALAEGVELVA